MRTPQDAFASRNMSLNSLSQEAEYNEDIPALTLGSLRDGEGCTITVDAEAEEFSSDEYGTGFRVSATFVESDYQHVDDETDEEIEEGDDVTLVSWSKRLAGAFVDADPDGHENAANLVGETVRISKSGSGRSVEYDVEIVDG